MVNNTRNTVVRSLHDVGAAGWFGGSLMGAVALNGASKDIADPAERSKIAAAGWARWAPFAAAAIGAVGWLAKLAIGGIALGVAEMSVAKMRVFRVPNFLGAALMLGLLGVLLLFVSRGM